LGLAILTVTAGVLASVIIFHPFSAPAPIGLLRVEFLDVGQGDSAFITFPNGETMLVDGGGSVNFAAESDDEPEPFEPDQPRIGEMVVSEFLWEKGYAKVDRLVVSHDDADHSQGLADVVRNFSVGEIWTGTPAPEGLEMKDLVQAANRYAIPIKQVGRGAIFEISGAKIEVLWPITSAAKSGSDNNSSLVLRLVYGESEFLFTGDIEKETEAELTAIGTNLNADVVKVPHHGSRTSSTESLVKAVSPRLAIIPVGRRSMFGHPHPEVVGRWRSFNADVRSTGENGTLTIETDGKEMNVRTFID
jgi:competence protein ComEC